MSYEKLKKAPAAELKRVLWFFGICVDDETAAHAASAGSVSSMRALEDQGRKAHGKSTDRDTQFRIVKQAGTHQADRWFSASDRKRADGLLDQRMPKIFGYR